MSYAGWSITPHSSYGEGTQEVWTPEEGKCPVITDIAVIASVECTVTIFAVVDEYTTLDLSPPDMPLKASEGWDHSFRHAVKLPADAVIYCECSTGNASAVVYGWDDED